MVSAPRPIPRNQAIAPQKRIETGADLSPLIAKRDVLFELHGYHWQHPRVVDYLTRCGVSDRHYLTEKQLKNLVEKLEALPIPNHAQKKAS